jgi:hypothetical protein
MSGNTISDLRKHLFDAIQGVRDGTMDIDKAKTVAELSKVVVESAKVEVDFMKVRGDAGSNGTGFIPEKQIEVTPGTPRLIKGAAQSGSK